MNLFMQTVKDEDYEAPEDSIVGGMAVLPERQKQAREVLRQIVPQLDEIWIATGPTIRSGKLTYDIDLGGCDVHYIQRDDRSDDARKFQGLQHTTKPAYYFALDDDLIYPPDYVSNMVRFIDRWEREIVACVHGSWIEQFPCESYYKDKQAVHFAVGLSQSVQVLFPGTGTTAFHTSAIAPTMGDFPLHNIADVQMAIAAQRAQVPVLTIPRTDTWLQQHPEVNALENSIWAERKDADGDETDLINGFAEEVGWVLPELPDSDSQLQTEEQ